MPVTVPLTRAVVDDTRILVGEAVAAPIQWSDAAHGANWMRAKGACLVPLTNPDFAIGKSTTEHVFRFFVKPRKSAIQRVWNVHVVLQPGVGDPETAWVLLKAPASTGSAVRGQASAVTDGVYTTAPTAVTIVETVSSPSDTEQEISISVQVLTSITGGTNVTLSRVIGIECYEQDRPVLNDDPADVGVLVETVRTAEPIAAVDYTSLHGVMQTILAADARRVGLYHFSQHTPVARLSAAYTDLLSLAAEIQGPKLTRGASTVEVYWSAYAGMSAGGGSGTVRLTTTVSAVSSLAVFTSTTAAWSTPQAITINCDDFDEVDGWRTDALQLEIKGDGTRSIQLYAVSVWVRSVA